MTSTISVRVQSDARVHPGDEEVGRQRRQHVDDADDDHAGRQHRQVLALGREQHRGAHPVVVEDLLDRDDPAEQVADLDGDDGDGRARARCGARGGAWSGSSSGPSSSPFACSRTGGHRSCRPGSSARCSRSRRWPSRSPASAGSGSGSGRPRPAAAWRGPAASRAGRRRRRPGSSPVMNSGIDDEVTPSSTIARSTFRSRRRAAYRPGRRWPIGIVMSRARPASLAERPTAARIWGSTGWPDTNDSPKSRVTMPSIGFGVADRAAAGWCRAAR